MRSLQTCGLVIVSSLIVSCSDNSKDRLRTIERYIRNSHYGDDVILLKEKSVLIRKDCRLPICKTYYGRYRVSEDTILFAYEGEHHEDELGYAIRKDNSITIFSIYERIKDEYSNLSAEELKKIDKDVLMVKDTASVDYLYKSEAKE